MPYPRNSEAQVIAWSFPSSEVSTSEINRLNCQLDIARGNNLRQIKSADFAVSRNYKPTICCALYGGPQWLLKLAKRNPSPTSQKLGGGNSLGKLVGATGFEPATSCTPCKRASQAAPRPEKLHSRIIPTVTRPIQSFPHSSVVRVV